MRNKAFTRQCCVCKTHHPKNELLRFTIEKGEVVLDKDQNLQGRGIYICKNKNCLNIAKKKNLINKGLKVSGSIEIYNLALEEIE